jgi:hypothetical protein
MDTLYELCESQFWWTISAELLGEWRDVEKKYIYMKLTEVKEVDFWWGDEIKFLGFMIIKKSGVDCWNWIIIS